MVLLVNLPLRVSTQVEHGFMTDLLDGFITVKKENGVKDRTLYDYRLTINGILAKAKELGLNDDPRTMTAADFRMTMKGMNITSKSTSYKVAVFKSFLRYAGNPLDIKFLLNDEAPNAKWISEDDFIRTFQECDDPTMKIILHLAGNYGMRRREFCELRMTDIKDGFFKVTGKGHGNGKVRFVPMMKDDPIIKEYIRWRIGIINKARRDQSDGRLVVSFHKYTIFGVSPTTASINIKRYFNKKGLDVTTHSLRREFVTTAYRSGADLITIQRLVGHTSPQTTERYIQNDVDAAIQAINRRSLYISERTIT